MCHEQALDYGVATWVQHRKLAGIGAEAASLLRQYDGCRSCYSDTYLGYGLLSIS